MSKSTEIILIVAAIAGVFFAYKSYQSAQATQAAATAATTAVQNPISTTGNEIENWFSNLWGSSAGGTPETGATS